MNELNKLSHSLENTIKDSDLQNVTSELAETFTDSILNDGLLRDIPIIGTIVGLGRVALNLNERLLVKKIISFISEIKDIDQKKRQKLIHSINNSEKNKLKVGEKLLYIIDKCEDHIKVKFIATLFAAFLEETITYSEFLRGTDIVQKIFIHDLEHFIMTDTKDIEIKITVYDKGISDFHNSLISTGICATEIERVSISDQDDWKINEKYIVDGGDTIIYLTKIGTTLKKILKNYF